MKIIVDMRETALLLALTPLLADLSGVSLTTAALPVGDIAIRVGETDDVLLERKSVDEAVVFVGFEDETTDKGNS